MKRIVFCFDGTWNRLDAPNPTNVVILAQAIASTARDGKTQIVHYDEGVGTGRLEKMGGGLFGVGLLQNMADAYRFLIFNYDVGDEIYIFGFSRGAYTARSFVGLIRYCGVLPRHRVGEIGAIVKRYQTRPHGAAHDTDDMLNFRWDCSRHICVDAAEDAWRAVTYSDQYKAGQSPVLRIRYLGVWDTVGSLGIPDSILFSKVINRKHGFHDSSLNPIVTSARHAVSLDENRKSFAPTLWDNHDALNEALGFRPEEEDAPYQQKWFPGTHGGVGGGGDIRGLSDDALEWVLSGAVAMGLEIDGRENSKVFGLQPDHRAAVENSTPSKKFNFLGFAMGKLPREPRAGPDRISDVSHSALSRWLEPADRLPEGRPYRPAALERVRDQLHAAGQALAQRVYNAFSMGGLEVKNVPQDTYALHTVVKGETLRHIALSHYGKASASKRIADANAAIIRDEDIIYPGQVLRIPID